MRCDGDSKCVCGGGGRGGSLEQVFSNKAAIWDIHTLVTVIVIVKLVFSCAALLQSGTYLR